MLNSWASLLFLFYEFAMNKWNKASICIDILKYYHIDIFIDCSIT